MIADLVANAIVKKEDWRLNFIAKVQEEFLSLVGKNLGFTIHASARCAITLRLPNNVLLTIEMNKLDPNVIAVSWTGCSGAHYNQPTYDIKDNSKESFKGIADTIVSLCT